MIGCAFVWGWWKINDPWVDSKSNTHTYTYIHNTYIYNYDYIYIYIYLYIYICNHTSNTFIIHDMHHDLHTLTYIDILFFFGFAPLVLLEFLRWQVSRSESLKVDQK